MAGKLIELDFNPNERTLRQFGFVALGGFGLLAACAWFETWMFAFGLGAARASTASVFAALALFAVVFSLVYPKANRVLYVGTAVLGYPIGFVLSYVIMSVLFFGIFAPIGLLLRIFGHDPMHRSYAREQKSYFSPVRPTRDKASYFRQF